MDTNLRIAIIDDDKTFVEVIKQSLPDYQVDGFTTSLEGIQAIEFNKYDILILDYYIDKLTGRDVVNRIRETDKYVYILMLTGYSNELPAKQALRELDIQDYCVKTPSNFESIIIRIESAIKSIIHLERNIPKRYTFGEKLRILRAKKNESQDALAKVLGVKRQNISHLETDRIQPDLYALRKIANYYDVTIDILVGDYYR